MRRKYSKAMKKRVGLLTNLIFKDSVREVTGLIDETEEDLANAIDMIRHARYYSSHDTNEVDEMVEAKRKVDDLYLEKMLSLTTQQLEEIVTVHQAGEIRRTTRTMEAVLSELTRRSILDDTKESDNRYNYGEVYGPKKQGARGRKKVASKRSKSSKN